MIKFFRKIRQNLLSENKFSKYLIYAIGEIILVVIGILIALAFNNFNEQNKRENQIIEIINQLENDILYNFDGASSTLDFYSKQEKICEDVLFDKLSISDYQNNDLISILAANWTIATPKSENLDYLLSNQKASPENYKPVINAAKILKDREDIMNSNWNRLNATIQENIKKITNEVSLIRLDSLSRQEKFEYMLTNKDYKKIIELYWIHAQDYSDMVSRYRAQLMATLRSISTIETVKENYGIEKLKALYKNNNMYPFIQVECNDDLPKSDYKERRRSFLLGNLSNNDVTLKVMNDNKITGTYTIKPKSFRFSRPEYAGIGGDYRVVVEKLDNEGNCIRKFSSVKNGYLIID